MKRKTILIAACLAALGLPAVADDSASHKADVEKKSVQVMPFSMNGTKHVCNPRADGGTQTVLLINGDPKQLPLVRSHLRKEAAAFAAGNFPDPASVHGSTMPGITTLEASSGRISVHYGDIMNGEDYILLHGRESDCGSSPVVRGSSERPRVTRDDEDVMQRLPRSAK